MLRTIRQQFFDVRPGEWGKTLALAFFFFLVIGIFWVLKPIKRGLMIDFYGPEVGEAAGLNLFGWVLTGAQTEQLGKVLNMVVAYGVVILFTLLVRKLQRQQVVYVFSLGLAGILAAFSVSIGQAGVVDVWTFYVFGDIFNTIMVATFWAFAADVVTAEESRRLYGLVGLGGVVGGFVGATFVEQLVEPLGRAPLVLGCTAGLALIAACAYYIDKHARPVSPGDDTRTDEEEGDAAEKRTTASAAVEGARLVFRSKYLLGILALIALYEIVSNVVDFQLAASIETYEAGGTSYDEAFGFVGQLIGIGSILVQLFVTTFVLRRYGPGVALLFLPIAILITSSGFLAVPVIGFAIAMSVSDNALNYSINQSAKESLYTPTTPDEKYKAKAFIDMFVQRAAKVIAVVLNLGVTAVAGFAGVRWLSIVSIAVLVGWLLVVRFLGQRFEEKAAEQPGTMVEA